MDPTVIAVVVLACSYGAALIGTILHGRLPDQQLDADSREVVKLVMGLVATMAALVLGLLVASANASHERQTSELRELAADIILLDQTLALYGPDAQALRQGVRDLVKRTHDTIWSPAGVRPEGLNSGVLRGAAKAKLEQAASLAPKTDMERTLKVRALEQVTGITKARLLMFESRGGQIPWPFLAVLIFWISMLFLGFGLLARFNRTVAVAQFLGAVSVAGAIFMILELNEPYRGLLQVSDEPLRMAITQLDQ
jgi:hypothetical protein